MHSITIQLILFICKKMQMFLFQSTNVIICTCKLDLSRLCKEMGDVSNSTFE